MNDILKKRALSDEFFNAFKENGKYRQILEIVQNDPTLELFLRGNYVTIYYKCARILQINENGEQPFSVSEKYYTNGFNITDEWSWTDYFQKTKTSIDMLDKSFEKEVQQMIVRTNNTSPVAKSTDYFIFDIEYTESGNESGRFDALAFCWPRNGRNLNNEVKLAFIEVKAGLNALRGDSGLSDHLKKTFNYLNKKEDFKDFNKVIKQMTDLNLLKGVGTDLILSEEPPQYIFILADYNTNSEKVAIEQRKMDEFLQQKERLPFDLRFATSPFMGYALYEDCMLKWDDFKALITKFGKQSSLS